MSKVKAFFIGGSAGGVTAVQSLLKYLNENFSTPVIVVLHLPPGAIINSSLVFGGSTNSRILEATDKLQIEPNTVYFAPPAYHLLIEKDFSLALSQDEPVYYSRPSIDVLFESAAIAYGKHACGILLTGANADGAAGLKFMQKLGGIAIVQNPIEAEAKAMPLAATSLFKPDFIGTLHEISAKMKQLESAGTT